MAHVVKNLPWCVIDIDTQAGQVFLQLRWKYNWIVQPPLADWIYEEKKKFHTNADRAIWATWSNRVRLNITGTANFVAKFKTAGVGINLDIRWVLADEHWNVTVKKIPDNAFEVSSVRWNDRTINLDTNDFKVREICPNVVPKICMMQVPVAHEFGHAIGNTKVLGRGDEYPTTSPHAADYSSIMNVGSQLRDRHFQTIIDELNTMIPDCTFSLKTIRN